MANLPLPEYIEHRIRASPPGLHSVVPQSTPVVSFGNAEVARVATVGINPSKVEFLGRNRRLLHGTDQRLETLESLQVDNLGDAPVDVVDRVHSGCVRYFQSNPYRRWFDQLERILSQIGASYYDGTACHLDLVQWATDPTWSRLSRQVQNGLIEADAHFLWEQLTREQISVVLLNGRRVLVEFGRQYGIDLVPSGEANNGKVRTFFFLGSFADVTVIGWSTNIQSSFGVSNEARESIGRHTAKLIIPTTSHQGRAYR